MIQSSRRILYIDDEAALRKAFVRIVQSKGYTVDVAATAIEANGLAHRNRYAVIATDYQMPGEDGLSAIRRLRALQPDSAYLMITGCTELTLPEECDEAELISQIIFKPWNPDQLSAILKRSVELHLKRVAKKRVALTIKAEDTNINRVLVVEDNPADLDLVTMMLRRSDLDHFEVTHAGRVSDALGMLYNQEFDAILVDLTLPDARGLTAVAMVHSAAGDTPILVMSGQQDELLERQAISIGAQDYLIKGAVKSRDLSRAIAFAIQRKRSQERLAYLANYNHLTGLPNRTLFRDRLTQGLTRSQRKKTHVGVMFLDLDRFKAINDTYGHDAGDGLLVEVAERLRACSRGSDTVAHLSGDEFTVILEDVDDEEGCVVMAKRILKSLAKPIRIGERDLFITCSIGIAMFPRSANLEQLIKDADDAMYQAKRMGRNQYCINGPEMRSQTSQKLSLESDLSLALDRDEFVLAYQPLIDIHSGSVSGFEALIRWKNRDRGMVQPNTFISVLEETGLIVPVGNWILETAVKQLKEWAQAGRSDVSISVNISARQFREDDMASSFRDIVKGIPPGSIKLELTEGLLFDDTDETLNTLATLKSFGFDLSVDDFGTGYSSLGYLSRYPVDEVKIDRSFINQLPGDEKACALAAGIVGLCHNLGLRVVAEGVETKEQIAFLRELKCDVLQGYYYAKPMFAEDVEKWWDKITPQIV